MCADIDWSATGDMLQGWGSILGALAIIIAAWFGSRTFQLWRKQHLSERKVQQAERILSAVYKARRQLKRVRSPAIWASELERAEQSLIETGLMAQFQGTENGKKKFVETHALNLRIQESEPEIKEIEDCLPMARALFGAELESNLERIIGHFNTVSVYIDANHRDNENADPETRKQIRAMIWSAFPSAEENQMDTEIRIGIAKIEEICLPALRLEL